MTDRSKMRRWVRRLGAAALAAGLVVVLAEEAPHLVHHFFEPSEVTNECPFLARTERNALTLEAQCTPVVVEQATAYHCVAPPARHPAQPHAPVSSRAPPLPLAA